jgi:hypothetical protein
MLESNEKVRHAHLSSVFIIGTGRTQIWGAAFASFLSYCCIPDSAARLSRSFLLGALLTPPPPPLWLFLFQDQVGFAVLNDGEYSFPFSMPDHEWVHLAFVTAPPPRRKV